MKKNLYVNSTYFLLLILSILFASTIQQFPFYKGNSLHLIHAIKEFNYNKLEFDWIANQTNHLPLFTYFNQFLIKYFNVNILYFVHFILLSLCPFSIFLICSNIFPKLKKIHLAILWFTLFIIIFHEHSFFGGVAGQDVINEGYQPASYGVIFFIGIYFFLKDKIFYSMLSICLAATFHPTYVIHSGFLLLSLNFHYFFKKKYFDLLKINIIYFILIFPITFYIINNFILIDKTLILEGSKILYERVIHHASIRHWFSFKDLSLLGLYLLSLYILRNSKLYILMLVFGFISIFFSLIQFFLQNPSLGLSFPWRSSVFLIPISSMIILSYLIQKISIQEKNFNIFSILLFILVVISFATKSHIIKNLNKNFYKEQLLSKQIKENYSKIDRLLIPVNLMNLRMNTGLPIFIDWKHPPFKYNEIIEWKYRLDIAKAFYNSSDLNQKKILEEINKIEKISHILFKKEEMPKKCNNLINNENFALVLSRDCFE